MVDKRMILSALCALLFIKTTESFDRFVNYTSVLSANDFLVDSDTIWVATSGGLYAQNRSSASGVLYSDPSIFPDPFITAMYRDSKGTLWMGSSNGYLYKRPRQGRQSVINSYFITSWRITDITGYGNYLIIASDKGCSVFDTEKLASIKNASNFGNAFTDPHVHALAVFRNPSGNRDSLLLGCVRGIAKMPVSEKILKNTNFFDPSIWKIDSSDTMPVRAFALRAGRYRALAHPGAFFLDGLVSSNIHGDSGIVSYDKNGATLPLPSKVTTIVADGGQCIIGTENDCFYTWNGSKAQKYIIPGPRFTKVSRVEVDREGVVWVCPQMAGDNKWWNGISALQTGLCRFYNQMEFPTMGWLGSGSIRGITEDRLGGMWFGTWGGNVKRFNRQNISWRNYYIFANIPESKFFSDTVYNGNSWAKCEAIACDSSGFLWIAVYWNQFGDLICYDPRREPDPNAEDFKTAGYRRFSPEEGDWLHTYSQKNTPTSLCVDVSNTVIVGYESGKIVTFTHDGNPLEHGIRDKRLFNVSGKVLDATTTPDTLTRLATTSGLYTFDSRSGSLTILDSSLTGVNCVEAEDTRVLWLGTVNKGLLRYDVVNRDKTIIDEAAGLLSNHVLDLSIDRKGGYLWVATEKGVSRYTLGYSVGNQNAGAISVYPNPFSKRRHREIVFEKLPPAGKLLIYTAGGSLVAALSPESASTYGAACVWNPPRETVPGIYVYTVRSGSKGKQGKFIITP